MNPGIGQALLEPPKNPQECLFSKMSTNFSADLTTRVEPCIFGGTPDCSQCGCVVSSGLHHVQQRKLVGPLSIGHLVRGSTAIGSLMNRLRSGSANPYRWNERRTQAVARCRSGPDRIGRIRLVSSRLVRAGAHWQEQASPPVSSKPLQKRAGRPFSVNTIGGLQSVVKLLPDVCPQDSRGVRRERTAPALSAEVAGQFFHAQFHQRHCVRQHPSRGRWSHGNRNPCSGRRN